MNKLLCSIAVGIAAVGLYSLVAVAEDTGVRVDGSAVLVATKDLDARFTIEREVERGFMVFGGTAVPHENAVARVTLAGLDLAVARRIHSTYPDFHRCSSGGARHAQSSIDELHLVPRNGRVLKALEKALRRHEESLAGDGHRVCLYVTGARLALESVKVREVGHDLTSRFRGGEFYLIDAVDLVDGETALNDV
jgi:hypothetical protein